MTILNKQSKTKKKSKIIIEQAFSKETNTAKVALAAKILKELKPVPRLNNIGDCKDAPNSVLSSRKRQSALHYHKNRKCAPVVFTPDDVRGIIESRGSAKINLNEDNVSENEGNKHKVAPNIVDSNFATPIKSRFLGAASITDILGFNPTKKKEPINTSQDLDQIPKELIDYYRSLVDLREHISRTLGSRAEANFREPLQSCSQKVTVADERTDEKETNSFDRDFALSMLSNDQEALYEIKEAIQRILNRTYGVCEVTGKNISKKRLQAVPFTRYSIEGQRHQEKKQRKFIHRSTGIFGEALDHATHFVDDDGN